MKLPRFVRHVIVLGDIVENTTYGEATVHVNPTAEEVIAFSHETVDAIVATVPVSSRPEIARILSSFGRLYLAPEVTPPEGFRPYGPLENRVFVRRDYSPLSHADHLLRKERIEAALDVLCEIPEDELTDPQQRLIAAVQKQLTYLLVSENRSPQEQLMCFFHAQQQFYLGIYIFPYLCDLYELQAAFWQRIGNAEMGCRLLRSIQHAQPNEKMRTQIEALGSDSNNVLPTHSPPEWDTSYRPRVLIIGHYHSDYGLDTLYDGLCQVLGADRVVEYPWKPFLQGRMRQETGHYPCAFSHPGEPLDVEKLCSELRDGAFDLAIYGDIRRVTERAEVHALLEAGGGVPLVVVDQWDDGSDVQEVLRDHIGGVAIRAYFKREMLRCYDYGPNVFPLPFAYSDERIPQNVSQERRRGLFWAGHRHFGLRRLYLEYVEKRFNVQLDASMDQRAYTKALAGASIGLDCFGFGYDTVRYREVPFHGAMLLAERKPIHLPYDYADGTQAVFFDDLPELEAKLDYYLKHADEAAEIAAAGREHALAHHTSSARARQFLGRVAVEIGRKAHE